MLHPRNSSFFFPSLSFSFKREWKAWNLYLGSFRGLLSILSLPSRIELLLAVRYCSAGYLHKDEILLSLIYARLASNVTRSPAWIIDISLKYRVNIFGGSKVELSRRGFATIARNFLVLRGVYRGEKEKEEEERRSFCYSSRVVATWRRHVSRNLIKGSIFPEIGRERVWSRLEYHAKKSLPLSLLDVSYGGFVGTRSSRIVNFLGRSVIRIHIFHFLP